MKEEDIQKLNEYYEMRDKYKLLNLLLKQEVFPIKDSYISYLKRDKSAINRNPATVDRIVGILYEMGINKIIDRTTAPKETNDTGTRVSSSEIPSGYSITQTIDTTNYIASSYPWGQCTWFVYNRAKQLGITFDPYMGNGNQWMEKSGYSTTKTPTEHSALSFSSSQAGADPVYGHVAFVEQVKSDGSILISESNFKGLGIVSYRTFDAESAKQFTYVLGH